MDDQVFANSFRSAFFISNLVQVQPKTSSIGVKRRHHAPVTDSNKMPRRDTGSSQAPDNRSGDSGVSYTNSIEV